MGYSTAAGGSFEDTTMGMGDSVYSPSHYVSSVAKEARSLPLVHHDTLSDAVHYYAAYASPAVDFRRVSMVIRGATVEKGNTSRKTSSSSTTRTGRRASQTTKKEVTGAKRRKAGAAPKRVADTTKKDAKRAAVTSSVNATPLTENGAVLASSRSTKSRIIPHSSLPRVTGTRKRSATRVTSPRTAAPPSRGVETKQKARRVLLLRDALHTALQRLLQSTPSSTSAACSSALITSCARQRRDSSLPCLPPSVGTQATEAAEEKVCSVFPFVSFPMTSHHISGVPHSILVQGGGVEGEEVHHRTAAVPSSSLPATLVSTWSTPPLTFPAYTGIAHTLFGGEERGSKIGIPSALFRVTPTRLGRGRPGRSSGGRGRGGSRSASSTSATSTLGSSSHLKAMPSPAWKRSTRRQATNAKSEEEEDGVPEEVEPLHENAMVEDEHTVAEDAVCFSSSGRKGMEEGTKIEPSMAPEEEVGAAARGSEEEVGKMSIPTREEHQHTRGEGLASSCHMQEKRAGERGNEKRRPWQERYHIPDDCPVEEVLLDGLAPLPRLPELIHRVADPHAAPIEDVSLFDFCAMLPVRQRHAVHHREDWLDAVYRSVQFQAVQDVRQLQLAGLHSIARWEEYRDRGMVHLTPYSRGRLESAYRYLLGLRKEKGEQMVVLTWLQRAIQRAIAEEFQMAALGSGSAAAGGPWKAIVSELGANPMLSLSGGATSAVHAALPLVSPCAGASNLSEGGSRRPNDSSFKAADGESSATSSTSPPASSASDEAATVATNATTPHDRDPSLAASVSSSIRNQLTDESAMDTIERLNSKLLHEKGKRGTTVSSSKKEKTADEKEETGMSKESHTTTMDDAAGEPSDEIEEEVVEEVEEVEEEESKVATPKRERKTALSEEEQEDEMLSTKKKRGASRKAMRDDEDEHDIQQMEDSEGMEEAEEDTSLSAYKNQKKEEGALQEAEEEEGESSPAERDPTVDEITPEPVNIEEEVVVEEVEEEVEEEEAEAEEAAEAAAEAEAEAAEAAASLEKEDARTAGGAEEDVEGVENGSADPTGQHTAATTLPSITYPTPKKEEAALLSRLGDLMITQVNSADGFLHGAKRELKGDERKGLTEMLDDDTAQVKAESLFKHLHSHHFHPSDSQAVRVLKDMWCRYNHHQCEMEKATEKLDADAVSQITTDEKKQRKLRWQYFQLARFHQQKSVDALVFGAVLLKSIAREERIYMNPGLAPPPSFGFPLLSSDATPWLSTSAQGVLTSPTAITSMTDQQVLDATRLYAEYFSDPIRCATPFSPSIDGNGGCSIISISQSTMHLYETSLKTRVEEEHIRVHFAAALLGVLHVLQQDILPRINTISYHILATATPCTGGGMKRDAGGEVEDESYPSSTSQLLDDDDALSPTNVVGIDVTGPFSTTEKKWLAAMALPLGLVEEVENSWHSLEDAILSVESHTGATVEHDVMIHKDDLEAFLTPTLASLLPEEAPRHSDMTILLEEEEAEKKGGGGRGGGKGKRVKFSSGPCTSTSFIPPFVPQLVRRVPIPEGKAGEGVPPAPPIGEDGTGEEVKHHLTVDVEEDAEVEAQEGSEKRRGRPAPPPSRSAAADGAVEEELQGEAEYQEEEMVEEVEEVEEEEEAISTAEEQESGGAQEREGEEVLEEENENEVENMNTSGEEEEDVTEEVDYIAAEAITGSCSAANTSRNPTRASHTSVASSVSGNPVVGVKPKRSIWIEEEAPLPPRACKNVQENREKAEDIGEEAEEVEGIRTLQHAVAPVPSSPSRVRSGAMRRGGGPASTTTSAASPTSTGASRNPSSTSSRNGSTAPHAMPRGSSMASVSPMRKATLVSLNKPAGSSSSLPTVRVQSHEEEVEEIESPQYASRISTPTSSLGKPKLKSTSSWMPPSNHVKKTTGITSTTAAVNGSTHSAPFSSPLPLPRRGGITVASAATPSFARPSPLTAVTEGSGTASSPMTTSTTSSRVMGGAATPPSPSTFTPVPPPLTTSEPLLLKKKKKKVLLRFRAGTSSSVAPSSAVMGVTSSSSSSVGKRPSESATDQWFRRPAAAVGSGMATTPRLHSATGGNYGLRRP